MAAPGVIDQHMRGYTERIGAVEWSLAMNCSPAGPWQIGVYDDPEKGRYDTGGSALASGVTATATSLSVTVSDGTRWTTAPGDFPFAVQVGGEEMTVTAISGTGSPQTFTVVRSVNGITKPTPRARISGWPAPPATPCRRRTCPTSPRPVGG